MATVRFDRNNVVARLAPGQSIIYELTVERTVADPGVRARIEGPGGVARIESLNEFEVKLVPCTDEDFRSLPVFPPTVRARARGRQLCERVFLAQSSPGESSLNVADGNRLVVRFELDAPPPPAQVHSAMLVLEGRNSERLDVPLIVVCGTTEQQVTALPDRVFDAVQPGLTKRYHITIAEAPSAVAVATLYPPNPFARIAAVVAYRLERREFTEEELAELPDEIREEMRKKGYFVQVESARAAALEPISMEPAGVLDVFVDVTPPERPTESWSGTSLMIAATTWRTVDVPFSLFFAHLTLEWNVRALEVRQGDVSEEFIVTLAANAGPATEVLFTFGTEGRPWRIEPSSVSVRPGTRVEARLRIRAGETAPVGTHDVGLWASWYDGRGTSSTPFRLTVRPGGVRVTTLHRSLEAQQGERVNLRLQVKTQGGHKRIVFTPALMPAGVRMDPVIWERDTAAFEALDLALVIDPLARPRERARGTVSWSAGDGEHAASFDFDVTIRQRPESRQFSQAVVTPSGSTLGGRIEIDISNDGNGRFRGRMFTSGAPSYLFRVRAVLRGADGRQAMAVQKTGTVHGSIDPAGSSRFEWDDPLEAWQVRDGWAQLRGAALVVSKSYELTGPLGTLIDGFLDVMEFVASSALLNPIVPGAPALAGLVLLGSELESITGLRVVGPGGLVGLAAAGAGLVLVGPGVIVPVFVGGILATAATVRFRPLNATERGLAQTVFGDSLPFDRIVITNLTGAGGRQFVAPNVDQQILVNLGEHFHDVMRTERDYPVPAQLFIHELTHAWQIAHGGRTASFVWSGVLDQVSGSGSYTYGPPGPVWSEGFSLEAQGSVVDEWFAGRSDKAAVKWTDNRPRQSSADPYFPYIANNIQMGRA